MKIKLGSRKSRLALWQTNHVGELLADAHEDIDVEVVTMDTLGDKIRDKPIPEVGGKGLFTAELEQALNSGAIDLAVHSLKDLPTELPDGLMYAGSPTRATPTDCLVSTKWPSLDQMPAGSRIATGSIRRRAQIQARHPDHVFEDLRGNIGTRLAKLDEHDWDGLIMATVALERLGMADTVTWELDPAAYVPAVGQGAVGLETRRDRPKLQQRLAAIIDPDTVEAVEAERIIMRRLEGGCSVPLGAHCRRDGDQWRLQGWAGSPDGRAVLERIAHGDDARELADQMADHFVAAGARQLLADASN